MTNTKGNIADSIKGDWTVIKSTIKSRFDKLTDESIDSVKDNFELLSSKLQSAYGYAKEQADKEIQSFKATLHEATEPARPVLVTVAAPLTPGNV